jgi:hypothetical protein
MSEEYTVAGTRISAENRDPLPTAGPSLPRPDVRPTPLRKKVIVRECGPQLAWRSDLPTYARVRSRSRWRGARIDRDKTRSCSPTCALMQPTTITVMRTDGTTKAALP